MTPSELFAYKVQFRVDLPVRAPYPLTIDSGDFYFCQTPCHCGEVRCTFRYRQEHPLHAFELHGCTPRREA